MSPRSGPRRGAPAARQKMSAIGLMLQGTEDVSLPRVRDALRAVGLRSTAPRVAVLTALLETRGPVSHAEMVARLTPAGFDPATIYRNLQDLAEAGLVARQDLGDHVWRFELTAKDDPHTRKHAHFLCEACGAVACLDDTRIQIRAGSAAPSALGRGTVEIQIKGICDACR